MTTSRPHTSGVLRRVAAVATATASIAAVSVVLAGTALADVPERGETAAPVQPIHAILILAGIPVLLFVVIAAFVYLPAMIRGERVAPGHAPVDDQWLGGPRRAAGELAGPDGEKSEAGGAGGRW